MSASDGVVVGLTQIRDRGPDSLNWNLVIVGDGFTSAEQSAFETAADAFVATLLSFEPFATEVSSAINVYRLDVHSNQSGADNPLTCPDGTAPIGGTATSAATFFDAEFCSATNGVRRLCSVDTALVETTVNANFPEWDAIVVIVNHPEFGGSGAPNIAVYSLGAGPITAIHELGHSAFGLADEYESYLGCTSGETTQNNYTDPEPSEPNVTANTDRATLKWASLVQPATAIPTTQNADCTQCDPQPSPVPAGTVGLFEGARYFHCGAYRPEFDCMMRNTGQPFCAVCRRHIAGVVRQAAFPFCFVASAVYGDPRHPDVATIRAWRDRHLAPGAPGRPLMAAFTDLYQMVGPPLGRWVARRPRLARRLRTLVLAPFAARLRRRRPV